VCRQLHAGYLKKQPLTNNQHHYTIITTNTSTTNSYRHHHHQQPSTGNLSRQYSPRSSSLTTLTSLDVACVSTTMAASHPNRLPTIFFCLHVDAFLCPTTVHSGILLKLIQTLTFLEKYQSFCCVCTKSKQHI